MARIIRNSSTHMEEQMIEGKNAKKSNWLPFVVVVIAAVVLIFASGGKDKDAVKHDEESGASVTAEGASSEEGAAGGEVAAPLDGKKKLVIAENFESWTENAAVSGERTVSRALSISGNVEDAFLYVDASVGGKELTGFHSVYFKLVNSGGHLFRPLSLDVKKGEGTTLLYDLSKLPYLPSVPYSEDRTPETANLATLLAEGTHPLVTSFISSLDKGEMHELSILYSCAPDSDCEITLR